MSKHLLAGPAKIIVATESKTLKQLGFVVPPWTDTLKLRPAGLGVYFASGPATVEDSPALPGKGMDLSVTAREADQLQFIAAMGLPMLVVAEGPTA